MKKQIAKIISKYADSIAIRFYYIQYFFCKKFFPRYSFKAIPEYS